MREQVDPRVQSAFESVGRKAPFGDLRQQWRKLHCATLNPYSSERCPYAPEDCALAFLAAVERSIDKKSPVGYFRAIAKSMAIDRADEKPLERDRAQGPRDAGPPGPDPTERPGLRGADRGPESIGALLRALDLGPRQGPADDGKASAE
jgi:hypothetical protein